MYLYLVVASHAAAVRAAAPAKDDKQREVYRGITAARINSRAYLYVQQEGPYTIKTPPMGLLLQGSE